MLLPDWSKSFLRSPITGAAFPIVAVLIGLIATFYNREIRSAWPFTWLDGGQFWANGPVVFHALSFWLLILVFAISLTMREALRSSDVEKIRSRYNDRLDELKLLTETSPPKAFLSQYDTLFGKAMDTNNRAIIAARKSTEEYAPGEDPLTRGVRFVLDVMLQLAKRWDTPTDVESIEQRTYRANIMWCWLKENVSDDDMKAQLHSLADRLYDFEEVDDLFDASDGFLKVEIQLSTKEESEGEADTEIDDLVLVLNTNQHKSPRNLPGAPLAAATGKANYVANTKNIHTFAKSQDGLEDQDLEKIKAYYDSDDKGRSIISLPIPFDFDGRELRLPLAVANIYRDHEGIMGDESRALQFAHLMVPFVGLLRRLLIEMTEA